MNLGRLTPLKTTGRRAVAAAPAAMAVTLAAMGVAMSASSTPRPDIDRTAEAVARATGGDLGTGEDVFSGEDEQTLVPGTR